MDQRDKVLACVRRPDAVYSRQYSTIVTTKSDTYLVSERILWKVAAVWDKDQETSSRHDESDNYIMV